LGLDIIDYTSILRKIFKRQGGIGINQGWLVRWLYAEKTLDF